MSFGWTIPALTALPSPVPTDAGTSDLFGYDIFFKNGDLQITAGGDYARVGGLENLKAAIYRRLITRPGEFRFRPGYGAGVQQFVKKQATQANLDALRQRIVDQLSQDRRIQEVDVTVESGTHNGAVIWKVLVRVTTGGNKHTFEPFTFAQEAGK